MRIPMTLWRPVALALAGLLGGGLAADLPPAPPPPALPLVDDLAYSNAAAVGAAWQPMKGSVAASVVEIDGRRVLRLPCNFKGTAMERASWDRAVNLDLTASQGLRFDFYCADPTPVSGFSFYLRSGGGWYAASFGASDEPGWSAVVIPKAETRIEDTPAGWGRIDALRISAWRGKDSDTAFFIANLAAVGSDARLVVIRGESIGSTSPEEAASVATYTKAVADTLDQLGLAYGVLSDRDVTAGRLRGKAIAILPHNPGMPGPVAADLAAFLGSGGKLLAFYTLPPDLAAAIGVGGGAHVKQTYPGHFASLRAADSGLPGQPPVVLQRSWNIRRSTAVEGRSRVAATWHNDRGESTGEPAMVVSSNAVFMTHVLLNDDPVNKRLLLLAMLGHLEPGLWQQTVSNSFGRIGAFGRYAGTDEAFAGVGRDARGDARAENELAEARRLRRDAEAAAGARDYARAMTLAASARERLLAAHCAARKPAPGEHRAWWCHQAFGVPGLTWDAAISNLAANGFTAILPNMLWGGVAYFPSKVLPVAPEVEAQGDPLAACVAACRKYGVACHVWKVNWNLGHAAPASFRKRLKDELRLQVGYDGKPEPDWLCPSHPANQALETDAMVEVATRYDVDGIHFDYIRYPGRDHCYCDGCRARFEAAAGVRVARWPADTRDDPKLRQKWLDFRRDAITRVVAAVHDAVKKAKPKVMISAAVFPNWPVDRDGVGQDWKLWCERGYLDFVCPMDYEPSLRQFEGMVARQREWAGKVPCYPGIGLSCWGGEPDVARLLEQIAVTRRLGTGGFTVFNLGAAEAAGVVPLCGLGVTRPDP